MGHDRKNAITFMRKNILFIFLMALCVSNPIGVFGQDMKIKKIGILVAMEKELRMFEKSLNDSSVVVKLCGIGKVNAAMKVDRHVRPGLVVTGDWFVDSKEKMREIVSHSPDAMAIDMESAAIAQVCHRCDVPFVSLRIISDLPMEDEHASQYADFWKTVSEKTFSIAKDFVKQITVKE